MRLEYNPDKASRGYVTCDGTEGERVVIPREIDGVTVSRISPGCFENNKTIEEVVIPETVVKIKPNAFKNSSVKRVIFECGSKLQAIEKYAFNGCTELQQISIPNSCWYIGLGSFRGSGISEISGGFGIHTIYKECFADCYSLKRIDFSKFAPYCQEIKSDSFSRVNLEEIIWPENVSPINGNESSGISSSAFWEGTIDTIYVSKFGQMTVEDVQAFCKTSLIAVKNVQALAN